MALVEVMLVTVGLVGASVVKVQSVVVLMPVKASELLSVNAPESILT